MSSRTLTSMGSFRNINETPDERYERLKLKYGKDLHDAIARKDKLRKDRKVNNWMEVYVLLNDQKPKDVAPIGEVRTRNGQLDPITAAGLVRNPSEFAKLRRAAEPSSPRPSSPNLSSNMLQSPRGKGLTISKQDREMVDKWLADAIVAERAKLELLVREDKQNDARIKEQREKLLDLQRQIDDLRTFEDAAEGQAVTINFTSESIFDKRVRQETMFATITAFAALVVMFIIMYFLK